MSWNDMITPTLNDTEIASVYSRMQSYTVVHSMLLLVIAVVESTWTRVGSRYFSKSVCCVRCGVGFAYLFREMQVEIGRTGVLSPKHERISVCVVFLYVIVNIQYTVRIFSGAWNRSMYDTTAERYRREKTSRFSLLAYICSTISLTVIRLQCVVVIIVRSKNFVSEMAGSSAKDVDDFSSIFWLPPDTSVSTSIQFWLSPIGRDWLSSWLWTTRNIELYLRISFKSRSILYWHLAGTPS